METLVQLNKHDPRLTWQTRRRLTLAEHEAEGPMVPVQDDEGNTHYWLFPTGATLAHDPMAWPTEPAPDPGPNGDRDAHDRHLQTLANRHRYWRLRADRARGRFEELRRRVSGQGNGLHEPLTDRHLADLEGLAEEVRHCEARARDNQPPAERGEGVFTVADPDTLARLGRVEELASAVAQVGQGVTNG